MIIELMRNATAVGAGADTESPTSNEAMTYQVIVQGGPTALIVAIEGSIGGNEFAVLIAHDVLANGKMFHIAGKPVTRLRANITTLVGGTNPQITVLATNGQ